MPDCAEGLIIAQRHVGYDEYLGGKLQFLAGADLLQVKLGLVNGMDAFLLDGFPVRVGEDDIKGIVIENAGAIHGLYQFARGLALAKTGYVDLPPCLQVGLLHCFVKRLSRYAEAEFYLVA